MSDPWNECTPQSRLSRRRLRVSAHVWVQVTPHWIYRPKRGKRGGSATRQPPEVYTYTQQPPEPTYREDATAIGKERRGSGSW